MRKWSLRNGVQIPMIGLGTFEMSEEELEIAIPAALKEGYALFDTAQCYRNEHHVGRILRKELSKSEKSHRNDIFITSKLHPKYLGYESTVQAIRESIDRLQVDYLDLFLIHWPGKKGLKSSDSRNKNLRLESWKAIVEAYNQGLIKSIGVSNFTSAHIEEIEESNMILPMVNQVEIHPLYFPYDTIDFCHSRNIFVQGYSTLGRGNPDVLGNATIQSIARSLNISSAQLCLSWSLKLNIGVIPKSIRVERIRENIITIDLCQETMDRLAELRNHDLKICWDPKVVV